MQSARKGTETIIGVKNSVAGFIMGPFAPKSSNISALKNIPSSTKIDAKIKVIIIWLAKVTFAFSEFFAPRALERTDPPPTPIAIPNDEIKNVIGKTTVTAAIASEPIHCPTNIVSTSIFTDMNKIPIEAGAACFKRSFFISSVPSSSAETAIYTFVFSRATHSVIQLLTVLHQASPSFKHGTAKNSSPPCTLNS
jgi:hypothetical protein